MKNFNHVILIAMSITMLVLSGCTTQVTQATSNQVTIQQTSVVEITSSTPIVEQKEQMPSSYQVTNNLFEDKTANILINYPQIAGLKGELLMDYMNQTLKKITLIYTGENGYKDVTIDYKITLMNNDILSVLFQGTGRFNDGKSITIQQSVNLDIHTSNPIIFDNLIKSDENSKTAVNQLIREKATTNGERHGIEFEKLQFYFENESVVFFFLPADDSATKYVEIEIPLAELREYLNTDFGEKPAS